MIAGDPYADLTDLYAFVSPDAPDSVTFIMNAIPYQDPMGGPNFYKFDDKVRYVLHIAQAGRNQDDIKYSVEFQTTVKNPNTFLYNFGPFAKAGDPNLNVSQTATVTKSVRGVALKWSLTPRGTTTSFTSGLPSRSIWTQSPLCWSP
jgi:hypothetical protein